MPAATNHAERRGRLRWPCICGCFALAIGTPVASGEYPEKQPSVEVDAARGATIEAASEVLGVSIGTSLEEARAKLEPHRDKAADVFREKKQTGRRKGYWRLSGTDYNWIMAWTNRENRIVQMSVSVRPERTKPFREVGDLSKATTNLENVAAWNVARPNKRSFRLVAKGPNRLATNIYLTATEMELR